MKKIIVISLIAMCIFGLNIETFSRPSSNMSVSNAERSYKPHKKRGNRRRRFIIHRKSGRLRHAICRDGLITLSRHRRGTCSNHRGVRRWLR
jgi:Protein of unknown function (DUF3761)